MLVGPLGLPGIALAIAIAAWIEALALLTILYRRLAHFELAGLAKQQTVLEKRWGELCDQR